MQHHVLGAIGPRSNQITPDIISWLCDYPDDDITKAVCTALGPVRLSNIHSLLVQEGERDFDTFMVFRHLESERQEIEGFAISTKESLPETRYRAFMQVGLTGPSTLSQPQWELLQIDQLSSFVLLINLGDNIKWGGSFFSNMPREEEQCIMDRLQALLETTLGQQRQDVVETGLLTPLLLAGEFDKLDPLLFPRVQQGVAAALAVDIDFSQMVGSDIIFEKVLIGRSLTRLLRVPDWSWDEGWGGGSLQNLIVRIYDSWDPDVERSGNDFAMQHAA
jgi:hypothetical protein